MKYIDADKLKTHIQYLIKKDNYELFDVPELLSFIDSLQQEQDIIVLNKKDWEDQERFRKDKKFGIPLQQEQISLPNNLKEAAKEYDEAESWCYEALPYPRRAAFIEGAKWMARQMKQEQPEDLVSLINEATTVAKRIIDRDSFYNSLPQNLRNKYTLNAWCEILEALSTMKEQEQPEVDLEEEYKTWWNSISGKINVEHIMEWYMHETARHFYTNGYEKAEKGIISIIESRIAEILGDAQPAPILRMELQELIGKIKEENK